MSASPVISRSQLEMYRKCPRCFWLRKRHGIEQPDSFPFTLNNAVDFLVKRSFDRYRSRGELPPMLQAHGLNAKLFPDQAKLDEWRNNRKGIRWTDPLTGVTLYGAVDDILEFPDGSLAVVDYKASGSAEGKVYPSYQFQLETYTYLLQRLGFKTAPTGYLAYFLAVKDQEFEGQLPFRMVVKEAELNPAGVADYFRAAVELAQSDRMPPSGEACDLCRFVGETVPVIGGKTGVVG